MSWLIIFSFSLISCSPSNSTSNSPDFAKRGETIFLSIDGKTDILCGTTSENYSKLITAISNNDNYGFDDLIYSGDAFIVPDNTKALVLELSTYQDKFRILEGDYKNYVCWSGVETTKKR